MVFKNSAFSLMTIPLWVVSKNCLPEMAQKSSFRMGISYSGFFTKSS